MKNGNRLTAGLAILCLTTGLVVAHTGASGITKTRMDAMSSIAAEMKLLSGMIKGSEVFEPDQAGNALDVIARHASMLPKMFPEGSDKAPSEAAPAIWQNPEQFAKLFRRLETRATALADRMAAAEDAAPLAEGFAGLAATCRDCHRDFRIKRD